VPRGGDDGPGIAGQRAHRPQQALCQAEREQKAKPERQHPAEGEGNERTAAAGGWRSALSVMGSSSAPSAS
jgi:hypothetical protein